jgi:hypothetical protein
MTPVDYKDPTTEDLKKLSTEELIIRLMRDCRERHVETLAQIEQVKARVGDVDAKVDRVAHELESLKLETRALGAMTARAIEAQLDPIRARIGGIADDTSAVRRTVNGANYLAHTKAMELEDRVRALEQRAANGGE